MGAPAWASGVVGRARVTAGRVRGWTGHGASLLRRLHRLRRRVDEGGGGGPNDRVERLQGEPHWRGPGSCADAVRAASVREGPRAGAMARFLRRRPVRRPMTDLSLLRVGLLVAAGALCLVGVLLMLQPAPEPACAFGAGGCSAEEMADYDAFRQNRSSGYATGAVALVAATACVVVVYRMRTRLTPPGSIDPAPGDNRWAA